MPTPSLLALPVELRLVILDFLDQLALGELRCVCSYLDKVSQPVLFRRVQIANQWRLNTLIKGLKYDRPSFRAYVLRLDLFTTRSSHLNVIPLLKLLPSLKCVLIASREKQREESSDSELTLAVLDHFQTDNRRPETLHVSVCPDGKRHPFWPESKQPLSDDQAFHLYQGWTAFSGTLRTAPKTISSITHLHIDGISENSGNGFLSSISIPFPLTHFSLTSISVEEEDLVSILETLATSLRSLRLWRVTLCRRFGIIQSAVQEESAYKLATPRNLTADTSFLTCIRSIAWSYTPSISIEWLSYKFFDQPQCFEIGCGLATFVTKRAMGEVAFHVENPGHIPTDDPIRWRFWPISHPEGGLWLEVGRGELDLRSAIERGEVGPVGLRLYRQDYHFPELLREENSLICQIVKLRRTDMMELFLDLHPYLADRPDAHGRSFLSYAAEHSVEAASLLLQRFNVQTDRKDNAGRTPISYAAGCGMAVIVTNLITACGANPDSRDETGRSPLSYACMNSHTDTAMALIETKGVGMTVPIPITEPRSLTLVRSQCVTSRLHFESEQVEADSVDVDGRTPLMYAAQRGLSQVVKSLIRRGVVINRPDRTGKTAFWFAARNGTQCYDVAVILREHGADITGGKYATGKVKKRLRQGWARQQI